MKGRGGDQHQPPTLFFPPHLHKQKVIFRSQTYCRPLSVRGLLHSNHWLASAMQHTLFLTRNTVHAWQESRTAETPSKLTFSHHASLRGGTIYLLNYSHTQKRPHILPHSLSCKHVLMQTHRHTQWIPQLKLAPNQRILGRFPRFNLANSSLFSLTIFKCKKSTLIVCKQSPNYV